MDEKSTFSRRNFVKGSATLAGGMMLGTFPMQANAFAAPASKIKIALVGCGGRGTGAAPF